MYTEVFVVVVVAIECVVVALCECLVDVLSVTGVGSDCKYRDICTLVVMGMPCGPVCADNA